MALHLENEVAVVKTRQSFRITLYNTYFFPLQIGLTNAPQSNVYTYTASLAADPITCIPHYIPICSFDYAHVSSI